jgi:hypothetical protein
MGGLAPPQLHFQALVDADGGIALLEQASGTLQHAGISNDDDHVLQLNVDSRLSGALSQEQSQDRIAHNRCFGTRDCVVSDRAPHTERNVVTGRPFS